MDADWWVPREFETDSCAPNRVKSLGSQQPDRLRAQTPKKPPWQATLALTDFAANSAADRRIGTLRLSWFLDVI